MSDSNRGPAAAFDGDATLSPGVRYGSIGAVWLLALVFAVLIAAISPVDRYASWLSLALAACVLLGLIAQLATQQKEGFVNRLAATVTGSFVILGIFGVVLGIVAATQ
ncbi:hypothetical protein GCM10027406_01080 [Leifsonia lichenia]